MWPSLGRSLLLVSYAGNKRKHSTLGKKNEWTNLDAKGLVKCHDALIPPDIATSIVNEYKAVRELQEIIMKQRMQPLLNVVARLLETDPALSSFEIPLIGPANIGDRNPNGLPFHHHNQGRRHPHNYTLIIFLTDGHFGRTDTHAAVDNRLRRPRVVTRDSTPQVKKECMGEYDSFEEMYPPPQLSIGEPSNMAFCSGRFAGRAVLMHSSVYHGYPNYKDITESGFLRLVIDLQPKDLKMAA